MMNGDLDQRRGSVCPARVLPRCCEVFPMSDPPEGRWCQACCQRVAAAMNPFDSAGSRPFHVLANLSVHRTRDGRPLTMLNDSRTRLGSSASSDDADGPSFHFTLCRIAVDPSGLSPIS